MKRARAGQSGSGVMVKRAVLIGTVTGLILILPGLIEGHPHKGDRSAGATEAKTAQAAWSRGNPVRTPGFRPPNAAVVVPRSRLLPRVRLSQGPVSRGRSLRSLNARSSSRRADVLEGAKIQVIDGDTFAYGKQRIRLHGIDTPELSEPGGPEAADRLRTLLQEGPVTLLAGPTDKYGRTVADVFVNQRSVVQVLTAEGYAKPGSR